MTDRIAHRVPIACSLTAAEYRRRADQARAITRLALRSREAIAGGVRLTFDDHAGVHERLEHLVAAETRCCPFLAMRLAPVHDRLVLEVTGPAEAAPIIDELFA